MAIPVPPGSNLRAEVFRRTQRASDTGRPNPDFDEGLSRDLRRATQHKVGEDPEFEPFLQRLDVQTAAPEAAAAPPEETGGFRQGAADVAGFVGETIGDTRRLLRGVVGDDEAQPPGPAQSPEEQALAEAREAITKGADPVAVRKRLQEMGIDPGRL